MATSLSDCRDFINNLGSEFMDMAAYRNTTPLLQLIPTRYVPRLGRMAIYELDNERGFIEYCGDVNYPTPGAINATGRYVEICSAYDMIKITDNMIACSDLTYQQMIAQVFQNIMRNSQRTIERKIYDALIGDVVVEENVEGLGMQMKTLTMEQDIGTSHIVDASAGFTQEKLIEVYKLLGNSPWKGRKIFLVPASVYYDIQKESLSKGSSFCCLLQNGIVGGEEFNRFGSQDVFVQVMDPKMFKTVNGKVRGFAFIEGAVTSVYSDKTNIADTCCASDVSFRASPGNGFISGIFRNNPSMQLGGLLISVIMMFGALRMRPESVVAIDFDPAVLMK